MISPIDAAIAPRVIIFKVYPIEYRTRIVSIRVIGMVIKMLRLALAERKNKIATKIARARPIQRLSVTLRTASLTKSA